MPINLNDVDTSNVKKFKPSFLFKAPPGFGKTIAAVSAAAVFGKTWLAYIDKNFPVEVVNYLKRWRPDLLKNIDIELYGSYNINEYLNQLITWGREGGPPYKVLITDGVTSLSSAAVNWSLGFSAGKRRRETPENTVFIPDFDEYKVETSLVTQALDLCKAFDVVNIWTAHPLPQLKIESGGGNRVGSVKTVSTLVSYGNKVGALVPGAFQEIYHFGKQGNDHICYTSAIGEEYAKTALTLPKSFAFTNKLFFEEWQRLFLKGQEEVAKGNYDKIWAGENTSTTNRYSDD